MKRKPKQLEEDPIERAAKTGDWGALARSAGGESRRNRERIERGETFASQARTGRSPSPSKTDGIRNG